MGDAVSHAVLPGIVLAYVAGLPLAIGAFAAGMSCALGVGYLKENSRIKEDTLLGVVFSGMFGLGIVLMTKIETDVHLDHILFGNMLGVSDSEMIETGAIALVVCGALLAKWRDLLLHSFPPPHARALCSRTPPPHSSLLFPRPPPLARSVPAPRHLFSSPRPLPPSAASLPPTSQHVPPDATHPGHECLLHLVDLLNLIHSVHLGHLACVVHFMHLVHWIHLVHLVQLVKLVQLVQSVQFVQFVQLVQS